MKLAYRAAAVAALAAMTALPAHAQAPVKVAKVGVITSGDPVRLREALRELGYTEGRNLVMELRDAGGKDELVAPLAADLVRAKVDVIVATYPGATLAAKRATSTIPIVMLNTPDPVSLGLVQSLARPGGNITGTTSLSVEMTVKQLEILQEAVPRASRIALVWNPDSPWHRLAVEAIRRDRVGLQVRAYEVRDPAQFDATFQAIVRDRGEALIVLADPMLQAPTNRRRLVDLALEHRLPSMGGLRGWAEAGGLLSYWAEEAQLNRRVASYVDRILKGASPATLPIEQPKEYELVLNRKTAKALGVAIPQAVASRATIIE